MIRIESLTKQFGRTAAVQDVSIDIPAGDSVALWGVNGAGKSTLIRCVLGLLRFDGRISIGGHDVARNGKSARMLVGYVPQELGFYDDLRVGEAVRFFAKLKGIALRNTTDVSGGMKQRLALAIALLGDPPVLVLDEVTASLDSCGRREFVSLLSRLSGGGGRTLLFASHRVEEVTTLAKRVVTLEAGRITAQTDARHFMGGLGSDSVLHLVMQPDSRPQAIELLKTCGFAPRLNGVGLLVPVPSEQKAAPLRVLAEGRITVDDFEILTGPASATEANA
jgi:ABC-2 type transport system ATP-binding protein/nitrous oxidase accessory protein